MNTTRCECGAGAIYKPLVGCVQPFTGYGERGWDHVRTRWEIWREAGVRGGGRYIHDWGGSKIRYVWCACTRPSPSPQSTAPGPPASILPVRYILAPRHARAAVASKGGGTPAPGPCSTRPSLCCPTCPCVPPHARREPGHRGRTGLPSVRRGCRRLLPAAARCCAQELRTAHSRWRQRIRIRLRSIICVVS